MPKATLVCVIVAAVLMGVCLRDAQTSEQLPTPKQERKAVKAERKAERRAKKTAQREERKRRKQQMVRGEQRGSLRYDLLLLFSFGITVGIAIGKHRHRVSARRDSWSGD